MRRHDIQTVLDAAGGGPKHHFGQNFMIDQQVLADIVNTAELGPADIVLEIGPGPGNLTALLAQRAAAVLAVDIDRPLLAAASRHWAGLKNVHWLCGDVLAGKHHINPEVIARLKALQTSGGIPEAPIKLVANLPYNIASPLVAELLTLQCDNLRSAAPAAFRLERMVFTVQWEVGQRMAALHNSAHYGALGILIQLLARVRLVRSIAPGCFWPPPKIRSALVLIFPDQQRMESVANVRWLQTVLAGLFSHRRQNLANALRHGFKMLDFTAASAALTEAAFDLRTRAETLPPAQLLKIADILLEFASDSGLLAENNVDTQIQDE